MGQLPMIRRDYEAATLGAHTLCFSFFASFNSSDSILSTLLVLLSLASASVYEMDLLRHVF